ncbi:hypothetical protein FGO68_gene3782 [Halteria grandinella]|uniref:Uncharacterized protein n=1 Tax=Halteria grandinella TaxID=5974 RepID=A0A8J8NPE2_HALGN|nr:hypothetical protein FGO68_gene3782 [Halteria grandinella]
MMIIILAWTGPLIHPLLMCCGIVYAPLFGGQGGVAWSYSAWVIQWVCLKVCPMTLITLAQEGISDSSLTIEKKRQLVVQLRKTNYVLYRYIKMVYQQQIKNKQKRIIVRFCSALFYSLMYHQ